MKSAAYSTALARLVLGWICLGTSVSALAAVPKFQGTVVVETREGMLLRGTFDSTDPQTLTLKTPYGSLQVPVKDIRRFNGEAFDPEKGVIRERTVMLHKNGDVTVEYLLPIPSGSAEKTAQVLVDGNVLEILDSNGRPLPFLCKDAQGLSRCTVNLPDGLLPAVRVRVYQKNAAKVEENRILYEYRYIPNIDQVFHLTMELPEGATVQDASPEVKALDPTSVFWEKTLRRQEALTYRLKVEVK